jgi:L-lactate dehydrogenase
MPVVLGREGVVRALEMPLSGEERGMLEESARALREVIEA